MMTAIPKNHDSYFQNDQALRRQFWELKVLHVNQGIKPTATCVDVVTTATRLRNQGLCCTTPPPPPPSPALKACCQLKEGVCLLAGCLKSLQQASVFQGRICSDNFTCCHTEIEVADQTFYLTQSQYTDTRPTSPSADPIMPGAWQGSHWSANFEVTGMTRPRKDPGASGIRTRDLPLSRRTP